MELSYRSSRRSGLHGRALLLMWLIGRSGISTNKATARWVYSTIRPLRLRTPFSEGIVYYHHLDCDRKRPWQGTAVAFRCILISNSAAQWNKDLPTYQSIYKNLYRIPLPKYFYPSTTTRTDLQNHKQSSSSSPSTMNGRRVSKHTRIEI